MMMKVRFICSETVMRNILSKSKDVYRACMTVEKKKNMVEFIEGDYCLR